jgi:hypothetical protein
MLKKLSIEFETVFKISNYVQETVQLELFDLKINNHLKDLYKEITDKNTDLIYKTLTDDFLK